VPGRIESGSPAPLSMGTSRIQSRPERRAQRPSGSCWILAVWLSAVNGARPCWLTRSYGALPRWHGTGLGFCRKPLMFRQFMEDLMAAADREHQEASQPPGSSVSAPIGLASPDETASNAAWTRFSKSYEVAFRAEWGKTAPCDACFLLDCIAIEAFDISTKTLAPVSKAEIFARFTDPLPGMPELTVAMAETALAFLAGKEMVVVGDDSIIVHPRFDPGATAGQASDAAVAA